ncbi:D-glycero-beta-D-manno-heptose-7-phosphate kinase [Helicobacter bizzozeronii]|uniref:D-glycero-beta-D-manno-heptose-7-phosphate kinase n=1 Tax=Helicobacter bizzozeronii TaxID=56877 RepID=UPI000CEF09A4|nr:D-glycero-beta-D-manno-heptose-7-phosphate kinase [Helicobacter bizzozeronii]
MLDAFLSPPATAPHILVVGDLIVDRYIWGTSDRLSPEAPVPVVKVQKETYSLGGAGNVADNLIALGARVSLCGVVGADEPRGWLLNKLAQLNISTAGVLSDPNRPTSLKSRVMVGKQQVLRIDCESQEPLSLELEQAILNLASSLLQTANALVLSDYNKGVLSASLCQALIALANKAKKPILCDPKGVDYSKYSHASLITPNKKEAQIATRLEITDDASLQQALEHFKTHQHITTPLITLSEQGMAFLDHHQLVKIPTIAREVYDVSGAGDSVIAALAFCLALGYDLHQACLFANASGAVVVGKVGSARASYAEVLEFLQRHYHQGQKILDRHALKPLLQASRPKRVVFTNGCFDLLHRGHVHYLQEAKKLGDILVVGLNSDSSVRALKGTSRPIHDQASRAFILAGLECVDFVVIFEEQTPLDLIKTLEPDILVKGGDYQGQEVVGSDLVEQVVLIDFVKGNSTTNIIHKIQGMACKTSSNKNF